MPFWQVGRPAAKIRTLPGIDPVPDSQNGVEVEVLDRVGFAVSGSCCKKRNNWGRLPLWQFILSFL